MIRIFLKLYLLVIIPLLLVFFLPSNPARYLIDGWSHDLVAEQYKGTFFLLQKELENVPKENWAAHIEALNKEFSRELRLDLIEEIDIDESRRSKLLRDGLLVTAEGVPGYWYRIRGSNYAIYNGLEDSVEERFHREAQGTMFLLRKWFNGYEDPQQGLGELREHFGFPLVLLREAGLELDEQQKRELYKGRIVGVELNASEDIYYGWLGEGDYVLKAGPVSDHNIDRRALIAWISFPALLLAVAALLWSVPFWRDLMRLKRSATALGKGELETRVKLSRISSLSDLGNSFNRMAERIKRLIDGHKELTNAVSHEFKTPVARLRFAHEMLREKPEESDQRRYLESIDRDLGELESLIDELLTHARYDRADNPIRLETIHLRKWLNSLMTEFIDIYPALHFKLNIDAGMETTCFDEQAISRALRNLLCNAACYARSRVELSVIREGDQLVLRVDDDGAGVPEEARQKVFESFTRLDSSRQRGSGGSGLGLAIVKRIAERHGGLARCGQSDLGGARFTLSFFSPPEKDKNHR